jgi:glycosyltransferase involved in cell wall biosynthesis
VKVVFIGSVNFTGGGWGDWEFYVRGGHIAIKAFLRLRTEFDNLYLTIRTSVPSAYHSLLNSDRHISVIDRTLSKDEFSELLWDSDICMNPFIDTPWLTFLDAMNHELPIVTTRLHANAEIVQNGKWGLVCDVPPIFNPIIGNYHIANAEQLKRLRNAWLYDGNAITDGIVEAMRPLIKDATLRREMGEAGRKTIEPHGPFSLESRNNAMKDILDKVVHG